MNDFTIDNKDIEELKIKCNHDNFNDIKFPEMELLDIYCKNKKNKIFIKIYNANEHPKLIYQEDTLYSYQSYIFYSLHSYRNVSKNSLVYDLIIRNEVLNEVNINKLQLDKNIDFIFHSDNLRKQYSIIFETTIEQYVKIIQYLHLKSIIHLENLNNQNNFFKKLEDSIQFNYLDKEHTRNLRTKILNYCIDNNVVPKKINKFEINVNNISDNIFKRVDLFKILSQCYIFESQIKKQNLDFIKKINIVLKNKIDKFDENNTDSLFANNLIRFCKIHQRHIFNKDLSFNPDFSEFYNKLDVLCQKDPNFNDSISNITTLLSEKRLGIDLSSLSDYKKEEFVPEVLVLDLDKFKKISSVSFFQKFSSSIINLTSILIEENQFNLLTMNNGTGKNLKRYFYSIQKTSHEANQDKVFNQLDYILNYYMLNNKEYKINNVNEIRTLLLQKDLEDSIPLTTKKTTINKF